MDSSNNNFGLKTNIDYKDLEEASQKIANDRPSNKYRAKLRCEGKKFHQEDYIKLKVKGYKKELYLKTFCSYNKDSIPKAAVFLIHGLGSHSEQGTGLVKCLVDAGYFVCAFDHREHGYSDIDIGYIYNIDDLINDTINFIKLTEDFLEKEFKTKLSKFIMGISMGGLIINFVSKKVIFDGVVYFAPCFNMTQGCMMKFGISLISFFYPTKTIPVNKESLVTKNPVFKEQPCPLMEQHLPTIGTVQSIINKCNEFKKEGNTSHEQAMLFIIAGVEKLVCNKTILDYYNNSKVKDKSLLYYPNLWHAIYLEEEMDDIESRLVSWLNERIKK